MTATSGLPAPQPLVSSEVDLRDYPYMPVDIVRLFGSEFHARADDGAWRAGVTLWLKSYHQVPASSLPDDDVVLARLAEYGRDVKGWQAVREVAMHGWVKCSDGKFYHPVVAEKALEAWLDRLAQRKSSEAGNAKRYGHTFDGRALDAAIEKTAGLLAALNPNSRSLRRRISRLSPPAPMEDLFSPDGSPEDDDLECGRDRKGGEAKRSEDPSSDQRRSEPSHLPIDEQSAGEEVVDDETKARAGPSAFKRSRYPADFDAFWSGYPTDASMSKQEAFDAWRRLGAGDRTDATRALPAFCAHKAAKPDSRMLNPARYLRERRWEGIIQAGEASPARKPLEVTFVRMDTPLWERCKARYKIDKGKNPPLTDFGWYFPNAYLDEPVRELA